MTVELKYCSMWGYEPKAVSLAAALLTGFKQRIGGLTLVPAGGGCFELSVGGELVYSKLQTGTFPDEGAMLEAVGQRLKAKR